MRLIQALFLTCAVIICRPVLCGPIIVGEGAGLSEFSIVFAQANLAELFSVCVSPGCGLNSDEEKFFSSILNKADKTPKALFKTRREMEDRLYFIFAEEIWFNQDLLWLDEERTVPYEVASAVALWFEILSQNSSSPIQSKLVATLSAKIQRFVASSKVEFDFNALIWQRQASDLLYIRDPSGQTIDVNELIEKKVVCENTGAQNLKITSATWTIRAEQSVVQPRLSISLSWACGEIYFKSRGVFFLKAIKNRNNHFEFIASETDFYLEGQ